VNNYKICKMNIFFTEYFKRQLKKLHKKYPQAKEDLLETLDGLDLSREISIGRSIYKIRVKSTDQQKGKSGGFRCYLYFYQKKDGIVPLCIYPKSSRETISDQELQWHVNKMNEELMIAIEQGRI